MSKRASVIAVTVAASIAGGWIVAPAHGEPRTLTKAADIARFPSIDPADQPLVRFEGVSTFVDPTGTVFMQDETGATFIRGSERGKTMRPGQRLLVTGRRHPGLFIGGIMPDDIVVLGDAAIPEPIKVTPDDLAAARHHYQLVEIEGVGRSIEATGESSATLRLNVGDKIVEVRLDQAPEDGGSLIDARLRVRGLAAGAINDRRQLVMPYVRLADSRGLDVLEPAPVDPFAAPVLPVSALLDAATARPSPHRVKIRGVATSSLLGGGFFLRDGDRGIFVGSDGPGPLNAGDEVEALGFAQMGVFSAFLSDAIFRVTGHAGDPEPLAANDKMLGNGACDAQLVRLDARVTQFLTSENALLALVGTQEVKVSFPNGPVTSFEPGALGRFTGLCRVTAIKREGYRATPTASELLLRTPRDAVLLSEAPWWNVRHLAMVVAAMAGIAAIAFAWIVLLRRQVARQLVLLQGQAEAAATREERQRIAREFHDTLEQELAGLSLRLDAAGSLVPEGKARELLQQLRRLLSRLQSETRDFVWDLRESGRQDAPLGEALKSLIDHLQAGALTPIRFTCEGVGPSLPPLVQHHLLRIAREAVANAVRHAGATGVEVSLACGPGSLRLAVVDDGAGFDAAAADGIIGHFGIRGMKERAGKIGADLRIESAPGRGTRLELMLALPRQAA